MQLRNCLQLPSQSRYSIAFAHICSHFEFALHDMCPEEKAHINEKVTCTKSCGLADSISY